LNQLIQIKLLSPRVNQGHVTAAIGKAYYRYNPFFDRQPSCPDIRDQAFAGTDYGGISVSELTSLFF
jgi:hypothetical protein